MTFEERMAMFEKLETGAVTDAMVQHGVGAWMEDIHPTGKGMRVFGRAVTAQFSGVECAFERQYLRGKHHALFR